MKLLEFNENQFIVIKNIESFKLHLYPGDKPEHHCEALIEITTGHITYCKEYKRRVTAEIELRHIIGLIEGK
jgi:hypothetical protein